MKTILAAAMFFAGCAAFALAQETESALASQLAWLRYNAENNTHYIIALHGDETIAPQSLPAGRSNVTITIRGSGGQRTVSLYGYGSLFAVGPGITLILDSYVILSGNESPGYLIRVSDGGTLIMNGGEIRNTEAAGGGAVSVASGGTFLLRGGSIDAGAAVPPAALPPAAALPAEIIAGVIPAEDSTNLYRLQVGAFAVPWVAVQAFYRLRDYGLNPRYERYGGFYRVVLPWLSAGELPSIKQTLGIAGFRHAIIRQETGLAYAP